jgi:hypothetical protein
VWAQLGEASDLHPLPIQMLPGQGSAPSLASTPFPARCTGFLIPSLLPAQVGRKRWGSGRVNLRPGWGSGRVNLRPGWGSGRVNLRPGGPLMVGKHSSFLGLGELGWKIWASLSPHTKRPLPTAQLLLSEEPCSSCPGLPCPGPQATSREEG